MKRRVQLGLLLLLAAAATTRAQLRSAGPVVEWAPDGRVLIAANGLLACFDLDSGEETLLASGVSAFVFSPDGARVAVGGPGRLELRRYLGFQEVSSPPLPGPVEITALAWSAEGTTLAAGTAEGHLLLWEMPGGELWADLGVEPATPVTRLRFSADGRRLLSAFADGRAVLWDLETRAEVHRYARPRPEGARPSEPGAPDAGAQAVQDLSPDGRLVLVTRTPESGTPDSGPGSEADSELLLLDDRGRLQWKRAGYGVEFTPDGAALLALTPPFRIAALYQVAAAAALRIFEPPEAVRTLHLVRLSPDGKLLLGVGEDHQGQVLIVWDFSTAEVVRTRR